MRILFISNFYPPAGVSGADRYIWDVTHKLAEKGIKIEVITIKPREQKSKQLEREKNLIIHRLAILDPFNPASEKVKGRKLLEYLKNLVEKKKFDLISSQALHLWNSLSKPFCSLVSNLISLDYDIPNILTLHSQMIPEEHKIAPKILFWDKIIGVSNELSDEVHSLGVEVERIATCHPGVDLSKFRPDLGNKWLRSRIDAREKDKIILFAGRLTEAKGLPILLKAFSTIASGKRDLKLLLAAGKTGSSNKEFEEIIRKTKEKAKILGIDDKVIIKPFNLDEMPHVYNGCDVFVLPSRSEGSPLSLIEAMACGLPVIGTSVGGIPEIISNGEDGYVISPENQTELAKRIEWLLKSRKKRIEMGKKGIEKARQKFDLSKTTEKLLGIYKSVIYKNGDKK